MKRSALAFTIILAVAVAMVDSVPAQETFPASPATEVLVTTDWHWPIQPQPLLWASLGMSSSTSFLLVPGAPPVAVIHPAHVFAAGLTHTDLSVMPDDLVGRYTFVRSDIGYEYTAPFPNDIFDQWGITLNPVDDLVSPLTVPFVAGGGQKGYILGTYFVTDGEDHTAPNRVISPCVAFARMYLVVQIRDELGTVIDSTFPFQAKPADELASDPDILDARFRIELRSGYFPGGITPGRPVPDVETRVLLSAPGIGPVHASPWAVSDANGRAESVLGAGTNEIDIMGSVPLPTLYVEIEGRAQDGSVLSPSGYAPKTLEIPDMRTFDGTFTLDVRDMDGNPLRASVRVSGGPMLGSYYQETKSTDAAGNVSFRIPTDGTGTATLSAEAHLAPLVYVTNRTTQIIDQPPAGSLHDFFPAWFSPQLELRGNAWTYMGKSSSKAIARIYRNGAQQGPDLAIDTLKRAADLTERDKWQGIDRRFHEAPVTAAADQWTCKIFYLDDDPHSTQTEILASDPAATPATVQLQRRPARDVPYHIRYVAVGSASSAPAGTTLLASRLPSAIEGAYNDHFTRFFPGDVQFTRGPAVDPDLWFFEFDTWSVSGIFRELENYRRSLPYHVDRIVGIVGPGGLDSYLTGRASGLSLAKYPAVVLLDPTRTNPHHMTHELLHTYGMPDETTGLPSADGYDHRLHQWIHNMPGSPNYNGIMYDYAANTWPRIGECTTLLDVATVPVAPKSPAAGPAKAVPEPVAYVSALVERVPSATLAGVWETRVLQRAPLFVDQGIAWAPHTTPPMFPSGQYSYGASLETNGGALTHASAYDYFPPPDINHYTGVLADNRVLSTFAFAIPWSDAVDTITMRSWRYDGAAGGILLGKVFARSANEPVVAWTESPAPGSTLAGRTTFRWTATDPDYGATLYAWPRISLDDGATWEPASGHFAIAPGESSFVLDARDFPASAACRVKILVSDDWHTVPLIAGPYVLEGHATGPVAHLSVPAISVDAQAPADLVLPVIVENIGTATLHLSTPAQGQPPWLQPVNATAPFHVAPSSRATILVRVPVAEPASLDGELLIETNDPARPQIRFPVSVDAGSSPHAPVCYSVATEPAAPDDGWIPQRTVLRIVARDLHGNADLESRVTIRSLAPGKAVLVDDAPMEPTTMPGEYVFAWSISESLSGRFGAEVSLSDPATDLADEDGSNPRGDDVRFRLGSPNLPPALSVVSPSTAIDDPAECYPGDEIVLQYAASDPDDDVLAFAFDQSVAIPLAWDRTASTLRGVVPRFTSGDVQVRLVARDPSGARAAAGWFLKVRSAVTNPDSARAIPDLQTGTVIAGPTKLLAASVYTKTAQQGCRYDMRPAGKADWQTIALAPYTGSDVQSQYTGATYWDTGAIAPGARVDVRYVNVSAGGVDHPNPVVVQYRKAVDGAAILSIDVDPPVPRCGQPATLRIAVRNDSTQTWTGASGHLLKPPSGATDPLTSASQLAASPAWAQIPPDAIAAYELSFTAPATPGQYLTRWQPWLSSIGLYASPSELAVTVAEPEGSDLLIVR